jgi:hypothetical protein
MSHAHHRLDTVVAGNRYPEGQAYQYASVPEARIEADRWVAQSIRFATNGTHWNDIEHGRRVLRIRGYDSGQVSVYEQRDGAGRREWTSDEVHQALERHGLQRLRDRRGANR